MPRRQPGGQGPVRRSTRPVRVRGGRDGDRSSSRPAAARRAAAAGAAKRTNAPSQGGLTGRASVLLLVLAILVFGYAIPIRLYLTQVAEIDNLRRSQEAQRAHIGMLEETAEKWRDPEYLRIQVRKRLFYMAPGETALIPIWDPDGPARDNGTLPAADQTPGSWYGTLWSSLDEANKE
jgi:cell division protein FtsB